MARPSTLYQRSDDEPPIVLATGGITRMVAALRHQTTVRLRDGWRIEQDRDWHVMVSRGSSRIQLWIESEAPKPR